MNSNNKIEKESNSLKRVFSPNASSLSSEELKSFSDNEKTFAKECDDESMWLELFCPDNSCELYENTQLP